MTQINKFQIDRTVKTEKSESELVNSIKKFNHKKIDITNGIMTIYGKTFYDFVCEINSSEVRLTAKPKKMLLIFVLIFLIIWTVGFILEHGILFGVVTTIFILFFFGFVHRKLMELSLDEITELIKKVE
ncbi:hypothetical protein ACKGJY_15425 [Hyunsoonleella sp. 2307UL5-6]|uniref:hypothetical protein n=1 Tax=Hyunsoonleella sp. 2307UL5-6 TaxID=3384768 RepID=UPI0039BC3B0A